MLILMLKGALIPLDHSKILQLPSMISSMNFILACFGKWRPWRK
jgi:hypothetical protein